RAGKPATDGVPQLPARNRTSLRACLPGSSAIRTLGICISLPAVVIVVSPCWGLRADGICFCRCSNRHDRLNGAPRRNSFVFLLLLLRAFPVPAPSGTISRTPEVLVRTLTFALLLFIAFTPIRVRAQEQMPSPPRPPQM